MTNKDTSFIKYPRKMRQKTVFNHATIVQNKLYFEKKNQ